MITEFIKAAEHHVPIDVSSFIDILKNHSDYIEKTTGLKYWFVKKTQYNLPGLFIKKENEDVGFSYVHCIIPVKDVTNTKQAFRYEISPQILNFKNQLPSIVDCGICKKEVNLNECHIDHIILFKKLRDDWCKINKINIKGTIELTENGCLYSLKDRIMAESWRQYHKEHCTLRPACIKCNLSRGSRDIVT